MMQAFENFNGLVVPFDRFNIDTDAIIPKQFLKSIHRSGFGENLFDEWRYLDHGEPGQDNKKRPLNPDFVLNQQRYQGASVLLARDNFGCGSSREHALWALLEYGIRVVIAPSFADIFHSNSIKNGLLPIVLKEDIVDNLFQSVFDAEAFALDIDLEQQCVRTADDSSYAFDIAPSQRHQLLMGLDETALILTHKQAIIDYEQRRKKQAPWLFEPLDVEGYDK